MMRARRFRIVKRNLATKKEHTVISDLLWAEAERTHHALLDHLDYIHYELVIEEEVTCLIE